MDIEVQKQVAKFSSKKVIIITLAIFIMLMLAITAQLSYMALNYKSIYSGVYVNSLYAGNLSREELSDLLKKELQDKVDSLEITIKSGSYSQILKFKEAKVAYNITEAVDKAYSIGRTGNLFSRFSDMLKARNRNIVIDISLSFDKDIVKSKVEYLYNRTFIKVKEADLMIYPDKVTISSGHHGESIDKEKAFAEIENYLKAVKGGIVEIPIIITEPGKINADDYFNRIKIDAQDAYPKVENGKVSIVPEVFGRNIDPTTLTTLINEVEKNEDTVKVVPVEFTKPNLTVKDVESKLFKDKLYTIFTQFYTNTENNRNRSENIKIAASKINGKILAPGEIFSFNETVGKRTVEDGYKDAFTFVGGKVIPGLAGGICQVSSTLYNAVLYSDLDVVERRNHTFVVSYAPYGIDATVAYGTTDFRFKNSTNWPLVVESWVTKDNKLYFSLKGTNENPGKVIELKTVIRKTTDYKIKYIDDPTLPEGQTKVQHEGYKGYIVDTYKITKINNKEVENIKISTSVYKALDEEVLRGTKKVQPTPAPAPTPTPAPTPPATDTTKPQPGSDTTNPPSDGDSTGEEPVEEVPAGAAPTTDGV